MAEPTPRGPDAGSADWLRPPIAGAPASDAFVAQTIEAFLVCLRPDGLRNLRPIHAPSLRLPMAVGREPADLVLEAVKRYGLGPIVVHSTSWRSEPGRVVLTYIAAVQGPEAGARHEYLAEEPIGRAELARGDATAAPAEIAVAQVLEHALRHLSWLVTEDPVVAEELAAWRPALEAYVPEPFRGL